MPKNGELDASGFIITRKHLGDDSKSAQNQSKSGKKHNEFKLWIYDLLTIRIETGKRDLELYNFHGLSVNIVNIYGVVTEVITNRFGVLYKVDDGTGNIGCWHDNRKEIKKETLNHKLNSIMTTIQERYNEPVANNTFLSEPDNSAASQQLEIIQAAQWLESKIRDFTGNGKKTLFVLGDTVNLRGKLADFRGERCIRIYNIQLVKNINEETDRRYELINLYENFYSKLKS